MLNLKFEHIRAFLHIARGEGNKRAANALHLSQPAITARIKNLESLLGTDLFDKRDGSRILSRKGELLFFHAKRLEKIVSQIESDVARPSGIDQKLRVGIAETVALSWLPFALIKLKEAYPNIEIELIIDISPRLHEALVAREIDLAIADGVSDTDEANVRPLPPIDFHWYAAKSDALRDPKDAESLFFKPVITYPRDTVQYQTITDQVWQRVGQHVPIFPSSSLASSLQMVIAGVGVASFPEFLTRDAEKAGLITRFDPGWEQNRLEFSVHYLGAQADPVARRVVELFSNAALEN